MTELSRASGNVQTLGPSSHPPAPHQGTTDDDVIDLGALFATLWRGKFWIAALTALAILIGGYYAYVVATPLYRATAVVILQTSQDRIVDLQSVVGGFSGDTSAVNSEVEVLRARSLMAKIVDRLDLVSDPEFNGRLRPEGLLDQAKTLVKGALGRGAPENVLPPEEQQRRTRDSIISALLEQITVRNVPLSLVFQVTVETENPEKSALIADTMIELYILNQIAVKFEATEQATTWLSDRVAELQVELETAEVTASNFSSSTKLVSIEGLQALERQIKDLRDRIASAEQARALMEQRIATLRVAETNAEKLALANDPTLDRIAARIASDPGLQEAFDTQFATVVARSEFDLARAEQQLTALRNSETDLNTQVSRQGQDLITLQQLTREAEATRLLYEYFLTRLKETSAQQGIQQADSRILSDAVVPNVASSPRKSLILTMSGILGLMLGTALILLREMRNNSFRSARELEMFTGYTVMGQLPTIPARNRKHVLKYLSDKPTSAAAEAVRNLRTSVMLSNVDNPPQVIVSTSSVPGEGKTTNSLALAQNIVGLGKTVLLLEGDLRRCTLNQYFENMPAKGLVGVLSGEVSLEDALHHASCFGADVLGGGCSNINAADLFSSDRFKAFIKEMRGRYDTIIIDSPPVLVVSDSRIIAQVADAVLLVVQWDKTSKSQVEEALRLFHNSKQRVTGLILAQISEKGMKQYGYGGQYRAYSVYGAKYYNN